MSNILIIGNGFDLYHKLPTRYTDFLFFVNHWPDFLKKHKYAKISVASNKLLEISRSDLGELTEESIIDFAKYKNAYKDETIESFSKNCNNHWVKYFNYVLSTDRIGSNWIDFEEEIQNALKYIEEYFEIYPNDNRSKMDFFLTEKAEELIKEFNENEPADLKLTLGVAYKRDPLMLADHKKKYLDHMLKELNKLIRCLNIYILEFVTHIKINCYSEQIKSLSDIQLLNFNYTDTFSTVYGHKTLIKEHSIHGNAYAQNIVLGIPDDSFEGTEYVYFQKYFQRIQKKTGSEYKKWLPDETNLSSVKYRVPNIYIFGHSLAETDKGILEDIFLNGFINHIYIYYHSQSAYEAMVINLIKMFGKEFVISNTGSERIVFKKLFAAKNRK